MEARQQVVRHRVDIGIGGGLLCAAADPSWSAMLCPHPLAMLVLQYEGSISPAIRQTGPRRTRWVLPAYQVNCSPKWHPDGIRMADCYKVTRRNRAFQLVTHLLPALGYRPV